MAYDTYVWQWLFGYKHAVIPIWRSERSECSHSQVIKIEICDIYIYLFIYILRATSC